MNAIPLVDSSSNCPLQKLVSRDQSTDVYKPLSVASRKRFRRAAQVAAGGPQRGRRRRRGGGGGRSRIWEAVVRA
uniref:Uncharacterized protein n=1 Tax=Arundo donax TaxID=35708 RepID=A0A0A9H837_ARUDO